MIAKEECIPQDQTLARQVQPQVSGRVMPITSPFSQVTGAGFHSRSPAAAFSSQSGKPCGNSTFWRVRPLCAVNNQHSHIDEELVRMQSQLLAQQPQISNVETRKHASKHHVFHDTELHPYQRQPQRHVHHEDFHDGQGAFDAGVSAGVAELTSAVELSHQYSSNIVNYRTTEKTTLQKTAVHRARVLDYSHASILARDLLLSLLSGGKLLLELPDEPAAVSSLMTALGRAARKLQSVGLATALDPVYDPAAIMTGGACSGTGAGAHAHAGASYSQSHSHHHHHHGHAHHGSGGGSPSASYDSIGGATARRPLDPATGCGATYVLCARAVPMPPAADPGAYTVGSSMGQEVLRAGPSVGVHTLMPALLRAVLRDGLCTLRTCWFDEDLATDSWSDDDESDSEVEGGGEAQSRRRHRGASASVDEQDSCEDLEGGCDASGLWSSGRSDSPGGGGAAAQVPAITPAGPAGSLVRVPCVLRAIFKLDRQLRGLDLGGVVVLPHTFTRSCADANTQVLYLDVVIA